MIVFHTTIALRNNLFFIAIPAFEEFKIVSEQCELFERKPQGSDLQVLIVKPQMWMSIDGTKMPKGLDVNVLTSSIGTYAANMLVKACFSKNKGEFSSVDFIVSEDESIEFGHSSFLLEKIDLKEKFRGDK